MFLFLAEKKIDEESELNNTDKKRSNHFQAFSTLTAALLLASSSSGMHFHSFLDPLHNDSLLSETSENIPPLWTKLNPRLGHSTCCEYIPKVSFFPTTVSGLMAHNGDSSSKVADIDKFPLRIRRQLLRKQHMKRRFRRSKWNVDAAFVERNNETNPSALIRKFYVETVTSDAGRVTEIVLNSHRQNSDVDKKVVVTFREDWPSLSLHIVNNDNPYFGSNGDSRLSNNVSPHDNNVDPNHAYNDNSFSFYHNCSRLLSSEHECDVQQKLLKRTLEIDRFSVTSPFYYETTKAPQSFGQYLIFLRLCFLFVHVFNIGWLRNVVLFT